MLANRNKDVAVSFLKMASAGDVREAYSKFVGPNFKHHNPCFEGSAETLMTAMEENARDNPNKTLDVKLAIAEGDLVDEFHLLVFPLVTGSGKRVFPDGIRTALKLIETKSFPSGVVLLRYQPERK